MCGLKASKRREQVHKSGPKMLLDRPKPQKNQPNLVDFSDEFGGLICGLKAAHITTEKTTKFS